MGSPPELLTRMGPLNPLLHPSQEGNFVAGSLPETPAWEGQGWVGLWAELPETPLLVNDSPLPRTVGVVRIEGKESLPRPSDKQECDEGFSMQSSNGGVLYGRA
jgi:hypothetical protein